MNAEMQYSGHTIAPPASVYRPFSHTPNEIIECIFSHLLVVPGLVLIGNDWDGKKHRTKETELFVVLKTYVRCSTSHFIIPGWHLLLVDKQFHSIAVQTFYRRNTLEFTSYRFWSSPTLQKLQIYGAKMLRRMMIGWQSFADEKRTINFISTLTALGFYTWPKEISEEAIHHLHNLPMKEIWFVCYCINPPDLSILGQTTRTLVIKKTTRPKIYKDGLGYIRV